MKWLLCRCPICGWPMVMVSFGRRFWRTHKPHCLRAIAKAYQEDEG